MDELEKNVALLQSGDIDGLKNLYELTKRSVFMAAFVVLRDYSRAEDVMQDAFIIVKNKSATTKPEQILKHG